MARVSDGIPKSEPPGKQDHDDEKHQPVRLLDSREDHMKQQTNSHESHGEKAGGLESGVDLEPSDEQT
jgi:hypothetical protein